MLGFLLGMLGSLLQISPPVQAAMQIVAAVFMVGTALNMLNAHPIFRYFLIQPPKALTRLVRNQAKSKDVFTPLLLGAMTILIPCCTTQAMEATAITSGSPVLGALILFVFVLGTSPIFFVLGFLASKIHGQFQKPFALVAALLIMFLGIVSLDGALNFLGLPSPSTILTAFFQPGGYGGLNAPPAGAKAVAANLVNGVQELTVNALPYGYQPNYLTAQHGLPIRLKMDTNNSYGCTRSFVIPSQGIHKILPETGEVVIDLPPQPSGYLRFVCGHGHVQRPYLDHMSR
ncbi:MAG: urease accessory protein UreH domain-containing protein [Aggregatilineales bacterium]